MVTVSIIVPPPMTVVTVSVIVPLTMTVVTVSGYHSSDYDCGHCVGKCSSADMERAVTGILAFNNGFLDETVEVKLCGNH